MRQSKFSLILLLIVTTTATLCFAARAAARANAARIGLLTPGKTYEPVLTGLREGLEKLGYKEGQNIRFLVGDSDIGTPQLVTAAAKLVEAKPDILFAVTTPAALAAKRATAIIPIVFVAVGVPIEAGLVASFASSGNNLTGISSYAASLSGKRLELLREIVPKAKRILLIASANEAISQLSARHSEEAARHRQARNHFPGRVSPARQDGFVAPDAA